MAFKDTVKKKLFNQIPEYFNDPVTKLAPANEVQMTSLLGLFHQRNLINWQDVNLYKPDNNLSDKKASDLLSTDGTLSCEWSMFAESDEQIQIWGQMSADLIYLSKTYDTIVLIENKIGSNFTSDGDDVDTGQLARQIKYLIKSGIPNKYIILLSSSEFFKASWYSSELQATLKHLNKEKAVQGYLLHWENIFKALRANGSQGF